MKFSIIIPTYNRANLIRATIDSVLQQTYDAFEILVVDDGSTDETAALIAQIQHPQVRYFRKDNGERGAARNYGIKHATGDYLTFLDSDDRISTNHLAAAAEFIKQNHQPDIFHQKYNILSDGRPTGWEEMVTGKTVNESLFSGNRLSCLGIFARPAVFSAVMFNEDRALSGSEDWLLWLQLAARFAILNSPIVTASMIHHDARSVVTFDEHAMLNRRDLLEKYLTADAIFIQKYGHRLYQIKSHMNSYIALHLAMSNQIVKPLQYVLTAWMQNYHEVFKKRSVAILIWVIKNMIQRLKTK